MIQKNKNADIFIYSHKPFIPIVENPVYKILLHCKEDVPTSLPIYRDDTGDNIADKNLMYNEYTGYYWLWKNYDIKNYIGMIHYRRYFKFYDDVPDFNEIFRKNSMIISEKFPLFVENKLHDNRSWYAYWHNVEDFDIFEQMYYERFPEFVKGFEKMKNSEYIYNSSLFIMRKKDFFEYCDYIFDILDEFCDYTGLHNVDDFIKHVSENKEKYLKPHLPYYTVEMQARVIGYLAERALMTYILSGKKPLEDKALRIPFETLR